ncbi:MAG TPA: hypothetical protein VNA16_00555 [Abditibacteriaceae bacterium]|nr:hypothetical protein [Abditibacteriaceae bacterium]
MSTAVVSTACYFLLLPDLLEPPLDAPDLLPPFDAPDLLAPDFDAPLLDAPDFDAPDFDATALLAPDLLAPDFDAPDFDATAVLAPLLDAPDLLAPLLDAPPLLALPLEAPDEPDFVAALEEPLLAPPVPPDDFCDVAIFMPPEFFATLPFRRARKGCKCCATCKSSEIAYRVADNYKASLVALATNARSF